jgi:hypothetical protein
MKQLLGQRHIRVIVENGSTLLLDEVSLVEKIVDMALVLIMVLRAYGA